MARRSNCALICTACVWQWTCVTIPIFLPFQRTHLHLFLMGTLFSMIYFLIYHICSFCSFVALDLLSHLVACLSYHLVPQVHGHWGRPPTHISICASLFFC